MGVKNIVMTAAGAQLAGGWIATLGTSSNYDIGNSVKVDSANNFYVGGQENFAFCLAKYNSTGTLQWQKKLGFSGTWKAIVVDSSGNIYCCGDGSGFFCAKYNSSGTLQWQYDYIGTSNQLHSATIDSSNNIYMCGSDATSGTISATILKIDSNGTAQWARSLKPSSDSAAYFYGIAVDSSGNVYAVGDVFAKYNSSGTLQWQKTITINYYMRAIAIDSSDNCYIVVPWYAYSPTVLLKTDNSGAITWQRAYEYGKGTRNSCAVDSSGNIYFTSGNGYSGTSIKLEKYNSSGTIQWQRDLSGGTVTDSDFNCLSLDTSGNPVIAGMTDASGAGGKDIFIGLFPKSGEGTGTIGSFSYIAEDNSSTASSLSFSSGSLTETTPSMPRTTTSLTDSTSTLTSTTTKF